MKHGMWSHALLLAQGAGSTPDLYASVLTQYALQCFADGSPLQTLYLLQAGQPQALFRQMPQTAATDTLLDFKAAPAFLRGWRANAAVMMGNATPGDQLVMVQLADTLWSKFGMVRCAPASATRCCFLTSFAVCVTSRRLRTCCTFSRAALEWPRWTMCWTQARASCSSEPTTGEGAMGARLVMFGWSFA
jgi:hypothetical protein